MMRGYTTKGKSLLKSKIFITYFVWYIWIEPLQGNDVNRKRIFFLLKWKR